jgi:hypothetical protein
VDGPPQSVTPDDVVFALMKLDERTMLLQRSSGAYEIFAIGDSAPQRPAKGFTPDDGVVAWTPDGRAIVVTSRSSVPGRVDAVDPITGARTLIVKELAPPERTGLTSVRLSQWIDDGKGRRGYVYDYSRALSRLFVATGVGAR